MRRSLEITDDHWALWARECREGIHNGYPSEEPYHLPTTEIWSDEPPKIYTNEDYELVSRMAAYVLTLSQLQIQALKLFWGAYPDADRKRAERYRQAGVEPNNTRRYAKEAMKQVRRHFAG